MHRPTNEPEIPRRAKVDQVGRIGNEGDTHKTTSQTRGTSPATTPRQQNRSKSIYCTDRLDRELTEFYI